MRKVKKRNDDVLTTDKGNDNVKTSSNIVEVKKKEKKVGRDSKYPLLVEPRLDEILEWLKEGYTDYSIAEQLGIHPTTFIKYKEENPNLSVLYTRAQEERNSLVMNKMFSKSCGMVGTAYQEKLTKDGEKVTLKSQIYVPPDVNAADLYLRNNDPDYKSAKSIEIGGSTTINFNVAELQSKRDELLSELQKLNVIDVKQIE